MHATKALSSLITGFWEIDLEQDTKVLTVGCILWLIFIPLAYWIGYRFFSINWLLMIPVALVAGYAAGVGSMRLLDNWLSDRHYKRRTKKGTGEAERFFEFMVAVFEFWYDHNGRQVISHDSTSGKLFVKALERSQVDRIIEMIQTNKQRANEASDWDLRHDRDVDENFRAIRSAERWNRDKLLDIIEHRLRAAGHKLTPDLLRSIVDECKSKAKSMHNYRQTNYVVDRILHFKW